MKLDREYRALKRINSYINKRRYKEQQDSGVILGACLIVVVAIMFIASMVQAEPIMMAHNEEYVVHEHPVLTVISDAESYEYIQVEGTGENFFYLLKDFYCMEYPLVKELFEEHGVKVNVSCEGEIWKNTSYEG